MAQAAESVQTESDLFLSSAHGLLENVQKLLSSGSVSATISLSITAEEFTVQIQSALKQIMAPLLASNILARDIAFISIDEGNGSQQAATAEGSRVASHSILCVKFSVPAADVQDAQDMASRISSPDFAAKMEKQLSGRVRTVQWEVKVVTPPVVKRHTVNDRDKLGCTALHWAALNDRAELMRWLMSNGADKDAKANDGHSPLHWAALKGHVLACKALLDAGCCVDMRDQWMFTPLIRAAQNGHCLVVLMLLRGGADPSLFDEEQHNALHWAVFHRHHVVVRWLLDPAWAPALQPCLDAVDNRGATALHLAAKKSGREMLRKLLAAGADPTLTDSDGQLPAQTALAAKPPRSFNASFLNTYTSAPRWLSKWAIARGEYGRSFYNVPTGQGLTAIICIALAYVYYAFVLLPVTWGRFGVAHGLLFTFTLPMWYAYYKSWRGDPGIIPPQPELILEALGTNEMSADQFLLVAMSPKLPRAKYSRFFDCYVARFDHDCPWISNVVGADNISYFIAFCYTVTVCLGAWCYVCGGMIFSDASEALKARCAKSLHHDCDSMAQVFLWGLFHRTLSWLLLFLYGLYTIFTLVMSIVQTKQIMGNVTTNELINWQRYEGWERQDGAFKNPYDRGIVQNVKQFFSKYPTCPRGKAMNKVEIPLLLREQHEREMRHEDPGHGHGHGHSHGGKPCHGHGHSYGGTRKHDDHDLEAGGVGHYHGGVQKDASAGSQALPAAGRQEDEASQANLQQQLRDIGFDED